MSWINKFRKAAAFAMNDPQEQPGAATNATTAQPAQKPTEAPKRDSVADELPGENADPEGEYHGQGDMAQQGQRQPVYDYTPCTWMAQQLIQGEGGAAQGSVAQTREGQLLVSVEVCRGCEWESGCYGFDDDQNEKKEERTQKLAVGPHMPDLVVAEKVAALKMSDDATCALLRTRGYTAAGAEGIMRLSKGL